MAGVPFTQSSPTRLRLENGTARIENLRWNAQGNEVTVSGGATVTGPNPIVDLAVGGDVDLRILGAFASGLAFGGVARSDFTVKGLLASPEIVGSIGIMAGELRIDNPPVAASDFSGTHLRRRRPHGNHFLERACQRRFRDARRRGQLEGPD